MKKKMSNQNENRLRVLKNAGILLVLVPLLIGAVSATTWYVDDDGGRGIDFTKIQEAVDAAQDNDTIFVYNGTYNEHVTMNKRLILKGGGHPVVGGIMISADGCVIDGFNVTGSYSGIGVRSDYNMIVNNSIYDNEGDGIDLESSDYNTIMNNLVFNNSGDGIDIDNSFNNTIINNTVEKSKSDGIELDDSGYNTIANNSVFNNSDDGVDLDYSSNNKLINNSVYLNTYLGIGLEGSDYNTITNNSVFNSCYADGIKLRNSSNNNIRNNIIYSNDKAGIYLCRPWGAEPVVGGSSYNTITSNIIYSNGGEGIKLKNNSSNNQIYNNNLIYNDEQAYDDGNNNSWDNGPIIGGNYWSDHKCVGNPSNGSQPYYIDANSTDYYPFEDTIGELPPLPLPVPKTDVFINKVERLRLYTPDTYYFIDHTQTYNFDTEWNVGVWDVKNLDNVTYTITTSKDLIYKDIWDLYKNGLSETNSTMPFNHIGENYTGVLPLKDRFASCVDFYLSKKIVQDNPWADMVVTAMDADGYTRLNATIIPKVPSVSLDLTIKGKIIDFSYPSEFEEDVFFPEYFIEFYGDLEDLNQDQSYNFSILVDELKEVELWLDKTPGWGTEYSNRLTLPVSELGSVTVAYDVPVKWGYGIPQPHYTQSIQLCFKR